VRRRDSKRDEDETRRRFGAVWPVAAPRDPDGVEAWRRYDAQPAADGNRLRPAAPPGPAADGNRLHPPAPHGPAPDGNWLRPPTSPGPAADGNWLRSAAPDGTIGDEPGSGSGLDRSDPGRSWLAGDPAGPSADLGGSSADPGGSRFDPGGSGFDPTGFGPEPGGFGPEQRGLRPELRGFGPEPGGFAVDPHGAGSDRPGEAGGSGAGVGRDWPAAGGLAASGRRALGAFDPGRRGVRALIAVAVLVVAVAAFLAWRAQPRTEPVSPASTFSAPLAATPSAESSAIVVAVQGKVAHPGLVRLPSGSRVADAIAAAGGALPGVDLSYVNSARKLSDGELIVIGETPPPGAAAGDPTGGGKVNLNSASLSDLETLPGIGPALAQRIIDYRTQHNGFRSVDELRQVSGIGDAKFASVKDLVTV
jgi:competence protein ComEA